MTSSNAVSAVALIWPGHGIFMSSNCEDGSSYVGKTQIFGSSSAVSVTWSCKLFLMWDNMSGRCQPKEVSSHGS